MAAETRTYMAKEKKTEEVEVTSSGASELAQALVTAIQSTQPARKKTAVEKKPNTPWTPKDGSPKLKLKRRAHQHGRLLDEDLLSNEEIALLNKIRPGTYFDGHVVVRRRRDKGIDVDYPVKTAAQRLRLVSQFGIRSFTELLQRIVDEAANPKAFKSDDDDLD